MKLKAPEGVTSASVAGGAFDVDKNGFVEVPDELCIHLFQFGFVAQAASQDAAPPTIPTDEVVETEEQSDQEVPTDEVVASTEKTKPSKAK
jgi:hypothetical protein